MENVIWIIGGIVIVYILFRILRKRALTKDAYNSIEEFVSSFSDEQISIYSTMMIDSLNAGPGVFNYEVPLGRLFETMSKQQKASMVKYNTTMTQDLFYWFISQGKIPTYDTQEELYDSLSPEQINLMSQLHTNKKLSLPNDNTMKEFNRTLTPKQAHSFTKYRNLQSIESYLGLERIFLEDKGYTI